MDRALRIRILRGSDAILSMQPVLIELGRRTGQPGVARWLEYFLSSPDSQRKTPYLLMMSAITGEIEAAVLLYEYRVAGLGTGVFASDDTTGGRTVIARPSLRLEAATAALRRLMNMGAAAAFVTMEGGFGIEATQLCNHDSDMCTAARVRSVPRFLALTARYDTTLALLGARTRRNLRYYRRRAETELGAQFVPHVRMTDGEFFAVNRASTHPFSDAFTIWRHSLLENPRDGEVLFAGLRDKSGRWLSLIGGRRDGDITTIDWQMNSVGLERYSLSTAMRAFLLEHEIARGTTRLYFEGGTPHAMRFAFTSTDSTDVLAIRRWSLRAWMLRHFACSILPEKNFLRNALRDDEMKCA
ncbi:MAG TPA: hypothetical protein VN612_08755 [Acidobacteriaceae bacterium]|nr:hypothetical protein [Acidobacteriaceae bacterium]